MPRPKSLKPAHIHHKASGRGCVKLNGEWKYTGRWGTQAANDAYDRLIGEWIARHRQPPVVAAAGGPGPTVSDVFLAYWTHAQAKYRRPAPTPPGEPQRFEPTGELDNVRQAIRHARRLYGTTPARDFGPRKLKALRGHLVRAGQCRNYINRNVRRVVAIFTWAASEELVPASVPQALDTVAGLRLGEEGVRESAPVRPVPDADVGAVLAHLPAAVRAIVELQSLTGARQGELIGLRTCDVDRAGKQVWEHRPARHKTAHHGHDRVILFGPRAQQILQPYLRADLQAPCFATPDGGTYDSHGYRRAIVRACESAFGMPRALRRAKPRPKEPEQLAAWTAAEAARRTAASAWRRAHAWTPHRLRHSAATRFRRDHGMETTQVLLGHQLGSRVTEVYAEEDRDKARKAVGEAG